MTTLVAPITGKRGITEFHGKIVSGGKMSVCDDISLRIVSTEWWSCLRNSDESHRGGYNGNDQFVDFYSYDITNDVCRRSMFSLS